MLGRASAPVATFAAVRVCVAPLYAHFVDRIRVASISVAGARNRRHRGRFLGAVTRAPWVVVFVGARVAIESSAAVEGGGTANGEENQLR